MAKDRNLVPKIGLGLVAAFFLYGWSVAGSNATGSPVQVFGVFGAVLMYAAIFATLATAFVAARRAHRAGSWAWLFVVIFVWPLSYVYALAVNRHG